MTLDDFKDQQRAALDEFRRLAKSDAPKAKDLAKSRLRTAGIIDEDGRLAEPYR